MRCCWKKTIKAYTITELLVSLLISMLVMACMLQLYTYINNNGRKHLKEMDVNRELASSLLFLQHNMERAENVRLDEQVLCFYHRNTLGNQYLLQLKLVLKQGALNDTLSVIQAQLVDTLSPHDDITYLSIRFTSLKKAYPYNVSFSKSYNRDYKINQQQRYEHFTKAATR